MCLSKRLTTICVFYFNAFLIRFFIFILKYSFINLTFYYSIYSFLYQNISLAILIHYTQKKKITTPNFLISSPKVNCATIPDLLTQTYSICDFF